MVLIPSAFVPFLATLVAYTFEQQSTWWEKILENPQKKLLTFTKSETEISLDYCVSTLGHGNYEAEKVFMYPK